MVHYDKSDGYKNDIEPIVNNLLLACSKEKIPVFVTMAVKNTDEGTEYMTSMISATVNGVVLENDSFPKLVNVMNGFDTIPHSDPIELEYN